MAGLPLIENVNEKSGSCLTEIVIAVLAPQLPLILVNVKSIYFVFPLQLSVSTFVGILSVESEKSIVFEILISSIFTLSQSLLVFVILKEMVLPEEMDTVEPPETVEPPKITTRIS